MTIRLICCNNTKPQPSRFGMVRNIGRKEHFPNETRNRGMEHMSTLIRDSLQDAAAKQGFASSMILTGWAEIAGAAIAAISSPVRISYGRDGKGATLILKVLGSRTQEVSMNAPRIIERINASYGYRAIESIRVTQVGKTQDVSANPVELPPQRKIPEAEELNRLESSIEDIEDENLRNLLFELGKSVLSKPK